MREILRLRVFGNWVLRRIFRPKRHEVTGECRRLHNEEVYELYSSPNIIGRSNQKELEIICACSTYGVEVHTGFSWRHLREETTWKTKA